MPAAVAATIWGSSSSSMSSPYPHQMDNHFQFPTSMPPNLGPSGMLMSAASGMHMSPAYLPTGGIGGGVSGMPRAPSLFGSYPSPSFDTYASSAASNFSHGYASSASSSTAPLPSPDGYYGIPAYNASWELGTLSVVKQEAQQSSVGAIKATPRRRSKVAKASPKSKEVSPENGPKRRTRRYKTPSPQILRVRREMANARERRRMNNLNVAYDTLRRVLPDLDEGRRLSKMETLQMAQMYIECLGELIASN